MKLKILILLCLIGWILSEAISEGLYDSCFKFWSKIVQTGIVLFPMLSAYYFAKMVYGYKNTMNYRYPIIRLGWKIPIIYILLRIEFFGIIYNITRGLPHNYIGTTDWYDIYIAKYLMLDPVWWGILFFLIIFILKWIRP
jgi:hypothetical protein